MVTDTMAIIADDADSDSAHKAERLCRLAGFYSSMGSHASAGACVDMARVYATLALAEAQQSQA